MAGKTEVEDRLSAVDWSFPGSTQRRLTHSLHPWPAKFIPDIPAAAIAEFTTEGDVVLDPFCGCGTTAVEAFAAGRRFVVSDVNPLAVLISRGKCEVPGAEERKRIHQWSSELQVRKVSQDLLSQAPGIPNISYWFSDDVICQLAYLLESIRTFRLSQAFLKTVFSSIIVGVSGQESETRYRRVEKQVSAGDTLLKFQRKLIAALEMAAELDCIPRLLGQAEFIVGDARHPGAINGQAAALAVFSPPYPNSFDYHLYHRFRMFWLGLDPRPIKHVEIGAHLRYLPNETSWLADMRAAFEGIVSGLRSEGWVVCVVGNGVIRGEVVQSGHLLWEMASDIGLEPFWRTNRGIASSRKSFNLSDSRLKEEQVLVFRRP